MNKLESRKKDLMGPPIPLRDWMDFSVLKEIIGFFGHEQRLELWTQPDRIYLQRRLFSRKRRALLVFPSSRARQGVGVALIQKKQKGVPYLWVYRCQDRFYNHPLSYFTLLVNYNREEEDQARQIQDIVSHSVQEYFDPQY